MLPGTVSQARGLETTTAVQGEGRVGMSVLGAVRKDTMNF